MIRLFILLSLSLIALRGHAQSETPKRVLFVVSNAYYYGDSELHTANHFSEIVLPYNEFKKAGYQVDFVSPKGGVAPIGYIRYTYGIIEEYLFNSEFMKKLKNTLRPSEIKADQYQAIFYSGGGSAMFGVPENEAIQDIAIQIYEKHQGIISAICHGTAGIVNLKGKNGESILKGKNINGFPDLFEDTKAAYYQEFPFSIEKKVEANGGNFQYSKEGWDGFYQVDGRIVSGQDPSSASIVAKKVIELLESN